ncbi:MAG TPA: hypothetical protein VK449_08340 [Anaerolineales bacterium]|nr:hypothetical protein [Anaerolineales bacterium]
MNIADILLFDLDGVLLNSAGYHRSLIETVRQLSLTLGFGDRGLTQQEIDAFEASDITAEWDSSALCAALLLITAWEAHDEVALPHRLPLGKARRRRHAFPDVLAFLRGLDGRATSDPLPVAEALLLGRLDGRPDRAAAIQSLLRDSRRLDVSLTFRLVQVYNLGSERFARIYGEAAGFETPSFLETYDRPTLTDEERSRLHRHLRLGGRSAAIVTNRPSSSGGGLYGTPEAEIGVNVAGFADLPRIASGDLGWRAREAGLDEGTFLKPSPVHVLAGLRVAVGDSTSGAIDAAARLAQFGAGDAAWRDFDGARIALFEDAPKGHASATSAVEILRAFGVRVRLEGFGIAAAPAKVAALAAAGARTFPHVREALDAASPGWRNSEARSEKQDEPAFRRRA